MAVADREMVVTPAKETQPQSFEELGEAFRQLAAELATLTQREDQISRTPLLVTPDGSESVAVPPSVFQVLQFVVHHMARGEAISLMPVHMRLTTQEAADLLDVSRPFLIKLLDQHELPYTRTGKHRRIRLQDVLDYRDRREQAALDALGDLAREAQDAGDYFE